MTSVFILGGYGNFGKRIAKLLTRQHYHVVIAGRDFEKAKLFAAELGLHAARPVQVDVNNNLGHVIKENAPALVINTAGPFQNSDYSAAKTCISQKVPYVDLADGRQYVSEIGELDLAAKAAGIPVISGASTVPALSAAVLDEIATDFASISFLDFGISPGQRSERGLATTKAILGYAGKRLPDVVGYHNRFGWQDLHRVAYPGLGKRWMANCEVPDLDLLPPRYGIDRIRFSAGMELGVVHFGIWALSWGVRLGMPIKLETLAPTLLKVSDLFNPFGSDAGGMHIDVRGKDASGNSLRKTWHIVVRGGDGPFIPSIPAVVLAKKILSGDHVAAGARACVGIVSLAEYLDEMSPFDFKVTLDIQRGAGRVPESDTPHA